MSNLQNIRIAVRDNKSTVAARVVTLQAAAESKTPLRVGLVQINNSFGDSHLQKEDRGQTEKGRPTHPLS